MGEFDSPSKTEGGARHNVNGDPEATPASPLTDLFAGLAGASGAVLAVSGGPDSTALMHLAAASRPPSLPLWVATVDHGLRAEARHEAESVLSAAATLGLPAKLLTWTGGKPTRGLQERARAARYDLLIGFAREVGASHVVTAHTLDDQAETLLMRMAAGSGPRGLAGMRLLSQRDGCTLLRPFLHLRKARLEALCRAHGWPFVDEPGNHDLRFARVRWRQMTEALAAEGLTPERLGTLAERLARAEAALQSKADAALVAATRSSDPGDWHLATDVLMAEPDEIVLRVIDAVLSSVAPAPMPRLSAQEALLQALRQSGTARVRRTLQGCVVTATADQLRFEPEPRRHRGRTKASIGPQDPVAESPSLRSR